MKYVLWAIPILVLLLLGYMWFCLIRSTLRRFKAKEACRQRCRDARDKILADGKVEGPKGSYSPRRWARKWIEYSHAIPAPKAQSKSMPRIREVPDYPHVGEATQGRGQYPRKGSR